MEEEGERATLRAAVYEDLRYRLITGRIAPGVGMSTRGLAQQLGVSQMPVRDALSRLAAEGAVSIRSKRKVMVRPMTTERLGEIMRCRLLLEPEAAVQALPHLGGAEIDALREVDAEIDAALTGGNVNDYMANNFRFHFLIYRPRAQTILTRMIETLWMQFGPLMRVVYSRVNTARLVDQHHAALEAIAHGDPGLLRHAIASDIADGMALIRDAAE